MLNLSGEFNHGFQTRTVQKIIKGEVQRFKGWTKVRLRMNNDDVTINLELIKIK